MTQRGRGARAGAVLTMMVVALALVGCSDDTDPSGTGGTSASTPNTVEGPGSSTTASPPVTTVETPSTESVPSTSEPTLTLAPELPVDELPDRLLVVFTDNFGDANFAFCVQQNVLQGLEAGEIDTVDIDNYVRNLVTDPMRALLASIQNSGVCSG